MLTLDIVIKLGPVWQVNLKFSQLGGWNGPDKVKDQHEQKPGKTQVIHRADL